MTNNKLLLDILRYFNVNKLEGFPYVRELDHLSKLKNLTFENLVFPYQFVNEVPRGIEVFRDSDGFPYVTVLSDRKVYFPKSWSDKVVRYNTFLLLVEQHIDSPHYYKPIEEGSNITLDIGCAEANFTAVNYSRSKEFHLFDVMAMKDNVFKTFTEDNIIYHTGLVNSVNRIDNVKFTDKVDNIKLDVEGMEFEVLIGARNTILKDKPFIQVCTYHTIDDFKKIYALLKSFGYKSIEVSKGYMIFPNSYQTPPYFRNGLIYAKWE